MDWTQNCYDDGYDGDHVPKLPTLVQNVKLCILATLQARGVGGFGEEPAAHTYRAIAELIHEKLAFAAEDDDGRLVLVITAKGTKEVLACEYNEDRKDQADAMRRAEPKRDETPEGHQSVYRTFIKRQIGRFFRLR